MRTQKIVSSLSVLLAFSAWGITAHAQAQACSSLLPAPIQGGRYVAVISDLHFGAGMVGTKWSLKEDFQWGKALKGFLTTLSACGNNKVDLVIAGDMLELWQTHDNKLCESKLPNRGCSIKELTGRTQTVVKAHAADLALFGDFADRGSNHVFVIPGNHDSALLFSEPWQHLKAAMKGKAGGISRVDDGVWKSGDGRIVVEHGHQIGSDVNKYPAWPKVYADGEKGEEYILRPWGEQFVQSLFNEQEDIYPIIDNLSPETAGARYRMADRGMWKSVKDVARFIRFNVFETSLAQKVAVLGEPGAASVGGAAPRPWSIDEARKSGHLLFAAALDAGDPFRATLLSDDTQSRAVRAELDSILKDPILFADPDVKALCDAANIRDPGKSHCQKSHLNAMAQKLLLSKEAVIRAHLTDRLAQTGNGKMRVYVYGHTHSLENEWSLQVTDMAKVKIYNSGAFQRVIDEKNFLRLATKAGHPTPQAALKALRVDQLRPCYSAVIIAGGVEVPSASTVSWNMPENGTGEFVATDSESCAFK
jgi:UDP-2,3-diacylglucosamine pyrophosphatase LpxH